MKAFWMFLVFLGVARNVSGDGECDKPTGKDNMVLIPGVEFPAPEGTQVRFKCQDGYFSLDNRSGITCTNGQWSDLKMACKLKTCRSLGEVGNGRVVYSQGSQLGSVAHVVCHKGYHWVGPNNIYCGFRGWRERLPVCEANKCDPPNQITHGSFKPVKKDYEFSQVVTYSCEEPYEIKGSESAVCSANGEFNSAPPTCVFVECPKPQIEFGFVESGSRPPFYRSGWRQQVDSRAAKINPIECKVPEITHGEVVDVRPTYKYLDKVTLECSEGYELTGDRVLTCGEDRQWSGTKSQCTMLSFRSSSERTSEVKLLSVIVPLALGVALSF
ncbi:membrane cofactor protein-like [Eucyclogobius newberryi]|uniref:membrane cofactor protein-like n=1 Tax=Eucyclogobius newberryi TaxID=166745 RepID=UPI003B5A59B9